MRYFVLSLVFIGVFLFGTMAMACNSTKLGIDKHRVVEGQFPYVVSVGLAIETPAACDNCDDCDKDKVRKKPVRTLLKKIVQRIRNRKHAPLKRLFQRIRARRGGCH